MDGQPRWLSSCQCLPTWTQSLGDFLGWCHPPDHSALGENQLRPSVHFLRPALAAQRVTVSELPGQFAAAWLITPSPGQLSGLCLQGKWWTWNMTVCYDPIFPDISFYWLFEILMVLWWMKLTDGWCENNFNKQSQWCHNGKLIQTPDKCPSRPRPLVMVGCESLKICPSVLWMWPMEPPVRVTFVQSISPHWAQQRGGGCL